MAGGVGSRFWPYSRSYKPKQFLDILGEGRSLLQQTVERFKVLCPVEQILIVTNKEYSNQILEQIPELKPEQILLEPLRKNTAPCIAYANARIAQMNPNARIIVAPSDHIIHHEEKFMKVVENGLDYVEGKDVLLTMGVQPTRPETGYGYIQSSDKEKVSTLPCLRRVKTFTEKPNIDLAKMFVQSGDFYWNSGMFIWSLPAILNAYEKYLPDMLQLFKDGDALLGTPEESGFIQRVYNACDKISIDYGIMEKADNVFVACADFGWSDLGTWGSLYEQLDKDDHGNAIGEGNLLPFSAGNNMVHVSDGKKLVVIQGLEDYIVVDTDDVLMICKKDDEQQIREMVDEVKVKMGEKYV